MPAWFKGRSRTQIDFGALGAWIGNCQDESVKQILAPLRDLLKISGKGQRAKVSSVSSVYPIELLLCPLLFMSQIC